MSDYGLNYVDAARIRPRHYFVIKIYQNINHRYFNFLFELPKGMSLIGSYLVPSFSVVVTVEKIVLIKKVYSELNSKSI